MTHLALLDNPRRRSTTTWGSAVVAVAVLATLAIGGCTQRASTTWAQNSPVIQQTPPATPTSSAMPVSSSKIASGAEEEDETS